MERLSGLACAALAGLAAVATASAAVACTRILWNDPRSAVLVARTMDWPTTTEPVLTVLPRGLEHDGGHIGPVEVVPGNPLRWTSRYGSLVTTVYGAGAGEGLNERGLSVHLLYLVGTDFGPRDPSRPGLHAGLWAQYLLDNAATVAEALALMDRIQLVMTEKHGARTTVHVAARMPAAIPPSSSISAASR